MLIPFAELKRKYKINPKGVLHIGGSSGQERFAYASGGVERVIWVEPIPKMFEQLKANVSQIPNSLVFKNCISDVDFKNVVFNVSSNNGESSSMLEFGTHKETYPDIEFIEQLNLTTIRLDTLFIMKALDIRDYDFVNIDTQGSELLVLKGMGDMLRLVNGVYVEVNRAAVYKDCAQIEEITEYLEEFGLELKEVKWSQQGNWGDAFYQKDENMTSVFHRKRLPSKYAHGVVNVPDTFMRDHPFPYPPDNKVIFEKWFYNNFSEVTERIYLPVQWTGYLVAHSFGNDVNAIKELQAYVDQLDRTKKYYTIHQFDLGCMVDFSDLDILTFGMAGGRIDYPLPLLCMPHKYELDNPKTLFASFIGRKTHSVRTIVMNGLMHQQGCYISEAQHDLSAYCSILSSSIFSICPRGFGNNSFRIQESLQYGAIPVVISNSRLEPHNIPFEEYGVYIEEKDAANVYEILRGLSVDEVTKKQQSLNYYYDNFFTYNSTKNLIIQKLKHETWEK